MKHIKFSTVRLFILFLAFSMGCVFIFNIQGLTSASESKSISAKAHVASESKSVPAKAPVQGNPSVVGQWGAVNNWPIVPIHISLLPNGKVLAWGRDKTPQGGDVLGKSDAYVWDPATGIFTLVANSTTNLFCSGHSFLPDGRLLVTGGHQQFDGRGEPHTNVFNFKNNTWSRVSDMNQGRWYPTNTTLGTGEVLVVSGFYWNGSTNVNNTLPQVSTALGNWRNLSNATRSLPLYPYMHQSPDGRVFYAGPEQQTRFLNTTGTGSWSNGPMSTYPGVRTTGSSVMYGTGKILNVGGGDPPTNHAEVINLGGLTVAWTAVPSMANPRRQMNATLLADGKVLVTGGTRAGGFNTLNSLADAVLAAELWDPTIQAWTTMSSMSVPRVYHSTAILLPDGTLLSGGGGLPAALGENTGMTPQDLFGHPDVEIFYPPYLFQANGSPAVRPTISSAPTSVNYGQSFFVGTPNAASISKVTLIRLSSVTHTFNENQRMNYLNFTQTAGGLTVTAMANGNQTPPGHYMLFIVNSSGVPSVARILYLPGVDTPGVYRPSTSTFSLRNSVDSGPADITATFGSAGQVGLVGDWNGDGNATIGTYNSSTSTFSLRNTNNAGAPDLTFAYGLPGDIPVVGDWNNDGVTTIGVYRPSSSTFRLRNSNTGGTADIILSFAIMGAVPIVGDWDGNGTVTVGLYDPNTSTFYLRNRNTTGGADLTITFGLAGDKPVVGDWNGDGITTIGVYRQSDGFFYLRNSNNAGPAIWTIQIGSGAQDVPLAGDWDGN
jgi:hypothetical protein